MLDKSVFIIVLIYVNNFLYLCTIIIGFMKQYFKRRWFDRSDGWKITKIDPMMRLSPFFMRTRLDSQNLFEQTINIEKMEEFIKTHKEKIPNLSILHIITATMVRVISQRPLLNRFIVWNKMYARNSVKIALVFKQSLTDEGKEGIFIADFNPEDTLVDVSNKMDQLIQENKVDNENNETDKLVKVINLLPDFVLRILVWLFYKLDSVGLLPASLLNASPFHSSAFITHVGTLGIPPVYHHLYEFGTTSMFLAIGKKEFEYSMDENEKMQKDRTIGLKFTLDERVCDGYYYAKSMREFSKYLHNPELLLTPPTEVIVDPCVGGKRIK